MSERVKVRYLGPEKGRVMRDEATGEYVTFVKGKETECSEKMVEYLLSMNERGLTDDALLRAYDQHRFEVVESYGAKGGGD